MSRPDTFVFGAPKCGTTALVEYLRAHPGAFFSDPKEPHFFADDFPHYKREFPDIATYQELFRGAGAAERVGEASVWYLYSSTAAANVAAFAPDARIVVMLRDPVELVTSLHRQLLWTLDEDQTDFATAWSLRDARAAGRSLPKDCREPAFLQYGRVAAFGTQLERLFLHFEREQVCVVLFDEFRADTAGAYRRVLAHLGLPDDGRTEFPRVNEAKGNRSAALARFTQRPPGWLVAVHRTVKGALGLGRTGLMRRLQRHNADPVRHDTADRPVLAEVRRHYEPEVRRTEALLGRDLSVWRTPA